MTDDAREAEARAIAGNDEMLYRRIKKYGIHKHVGMSIQNPDECFICDRDRYSPIHLKNQ